MALSARLLICAAVLLPAWARASALVVMVQDTSGQPVADAVVWVEPEGGSVPRPLKPAEIEQRNQKFIPLVTVVQTGSRIMFPNNDKVRHHIYSFSPAHRFDQKLYSGTTAPPQVFDKAGTVVLGCNIHDTMVAYVKVVDTPYFAKTDATGTARIEWPGSGGATVSAWHYRLASTANGEPRQSIKGADGATTARFVLTLKPALPPGGSDFD
jgi:plastocyanin